MKIDKKCIQKSQKMKSKVIVLIFGESLPYKSGLGFFVAALEVPFFGTPIWPLLPKVPKLGPQKKARPVPVQKIRDHFYKANFPQKMRIMTFDIIFCDF